jgi:NAD-dependent deacetylase
VPLIETASNLVQQADIFLVIGTSLQVYPAAGLLSYFDALKPVYFIDPKPLKMTNYPNIHYISKNAIEGMKEFTQIMLKKRS